MTVMFHIGKKHQLRRLTVTKDDFYKIGILIAALCVITWMFLSNSWGADSNPKSKPSAPDQWSALWKIEPAAGMNRKSNCLQLL